MRCLPVNQLCCVYVCVCLQFDHRALATTTALAALGLWGWMRCQPVGALPRRAVVAADLIAAVTLAQWGLGIWTLLEYVPVHLGSAHQVGVGSTVRVFCRSGKGKS